MFCQGYEEGTIFNIADMDSASENLENWFPNMNVIESEDLGTEPLSRSQIFENYVLEGLDISPITAPTPSSPNTTTPTKPIKKIRERMPKNVEVNSKLITKDDFQKNKILSNSTPATVEILYSPGKMFLLVKNNKGKPMFQAQELMNHEHTQAKHTENIQKVVNVGMFDICKTLDYQLPQLVTNFGLKVYLCPLQCNKAYPHIADAKIHALQHMGIKPYKCDKPGCQWAFYTPNKLQRHKDTHDKVKIFVCTFANCKKSFSTIYNLNEHIKKHTIPPHLQCSVVGCSARFQNETQRKNHYKTHDRSEAPYKCSNRKCKRVFFDEGLHQSHHRTCKDSENTCRYPECGKTFQNLYRLKEHVRVHTGNKPYVCTYKNCSSKFSSSSKLSRHLYSHIGDKKHVCIFDGCNKSFFRSDHLKEHMLTHNLFISTDPEIEEMVANENPDDLAEAALLTDPSIDLFEQEQLLAVQTIQRISESPSDIMLTSVVIPNETVTLLTDDSLSTVNLRDLD